MTAEETPWDLTAEDLRARSTPRRLRPPDLKAVLLVAAAIVLIVAGFAFAHGIRTHKGIVVTTSTTSPPTTSPVTTPSTTVPSTTPSTTTSTEPSTTTTTSPQAVGEAESPIPSLPAYVLTSSDPPGLLAAAMAAVPYEADQFDYTYSIDPVDPSWFAFLDQPKPGVDLQGSYGYAHRVGSSWQIIGPGTIDVGCPVPNDSDPTLPAAVRQQFGLLACPVLPS